MAFHFDLIWKGVDRITAAKTAQEDPSFDNDRWMPTDDTQTEPGVDTWTKLANQLFAKTPPLSRSIDVFNWEEGSFTSKNAKEVLLFIGDPNQSHAEGMAELWLLRDQNGWKIDRQLADGDAIFFQTVDIENDGKSEIWIRAARGGQGEMDSYERVGSLSPESETELFHVSSYDNTGARLESGAERHTHDVQFVDLDNDGILEIVDSEERTLYKGAEQTLISQEKRTHFYKLTSGKFAEIQISLLPSPP